MAHGTVSEPQEPTNAGQTALVFPDNRLMIELCGEFDKNLVKIEKQLDVQIIRRGNQLDIFGPNEAASEAHGVLSNLYERLENGKSVEFADIDRALRMNPENDNQLEMFSKSSVEIKTRKKPVEPRTDAQKGYVQSLMENELAFGIGPAGTGKTYLAVAVAVSKFISGDVDRIILSRPAVEAGEKLGYLPGDMKDKVDPYMQPLYDALNDFLPGKQLAKLIEEKRIEIAPLAFMRGRTLANAFVVLDEAQNATSMQMKMFLTRFGQNSRMVICGDPKQIDIPGGDRMSGLADAVTKLENVEGIAVSRFTSADVVRHPIVGRIVEAYEGPSE